MPKTHDIVAVIGSYEKNGETKAKYKNCGAVIQKDGKMYIKLDALPIHESESWNGWFQCFVPKNQQQPQQPTPPVQDDFSDPIPF